MLSYYKKQTSSVDIQPVWCYSKKVELLLSTLISSSNYMVEFCRSSRYLVNFKYLYTGTLNLLLSEISKISPLTQVNPKYVSSSKSYAYRATKLIISSGNLKPIKITPSKSIFSISYYFKNNRFTNIFKWLLLNLSYLNTNSWNGILNSYKNRTFKFYIDFNLLNLVNYEYFRINYLR